MKDAILLGLDLAFTAISGFFVFAAIMVFIHCFYDTGFQWNRRKTIIYVVFLVVDIALVMFDYFILLPDLLWYSLMLAEAVARPILALYDYRGKRFFGFLKYFWILIIVGICSGLISGIGGMYVFRDYDPEAIFMTQEQSIGVNILFAIYFGFVYFYLYYRIYKQGIVFRWSKRERIFVAIYTGACLGLTIIIEQFGKDGAVSLAIMGIAFMLMAAMIPAFFYYLRISKHFQERIRYQETYIQAELAHFRQYKMAQEETRRFRHDIQNNLLCLNELLRGGRTDEAAQYVQNLVEITDTLRPRYVSGDEILDSILAVKGDYMDAQGISFQLDGVLAGGLCWKSVDICGVFANALDNAVEACLRLPRQERQITMKIRTAPQFWFVRIENPVLENVDTTRLFQKIGGYTTKDGDLHGIGTYNMKHTVETYGGMVKAECQDRRFVLEIVIPQ